MHRKAIAGFGALVALSFGISCTALKSFVNADGSSTAGAPPPPSSPAPSPPEPSSSSGSPGESSGTGTPSGWDLKPDRIVVVEPAAGKPKAKPLKPSWCATAAALPGAKDALLVYQYLAYDPRTGWPYQDWPKAASLLCQNPESEHVQRQAGYLVQLYVNRWDLTLDEAVRAIRMDAHVGQIGGAPRDACEALVAGSDDLVTTAEAWALADVYGCGFLGDRKGEWVLWREPRYPSALARLSMIGSCLSDDLEPTDEGGIRTSLDSTAMTRFLTCRPFFDQLDRKAILAELDERQAPEWAKIATLRRLGEARRRIAIGEQLFAQLAKKDKAWIALRDAAAARFAAWKQEFAAHEALFRTAFAVDAAVVSESKKARQACDAEPLRAFLAKTIKAAKPTTLEAFGEVVARPVPAILTGRLAACALARGRDAESIGYDWMLRQGPIARGGTRTELAYAMLLVLVDLRADRPKTLEGIDIKVEGAGWGRVSTRPDRPAKVAKVMPRGDDVVVSFAPEMMEFDECTNEVETRKIDRIDADGKLRYRTECRSWKKVMDNVAPPPITIPKSTAAGLAPGVYTTMLRARDDVGAPLAVYADKARKQLIAVFGFAVRCPPAPPADVKTGGGSSPPMKPSWCATAGDPASTDAIRIKGYLARGNTGPPALISSDTRCGTARRRAS